MELNHNQTRAFMNFFRAVDDAMITEIYQDETGASATVLGNPRVFFEGSLRFIPPQNGNVLNITEKKTPVLLTGDDETVEITWNKTFTPGIYQLRTVLLGQGDAVMDLEENVIEAKPLVRSNAADTTKKASFSAEAAALAILMIVILRREMKIMPPKNASLICTLALLALLMPTTIAEDGQNATANITMNSTQNLTGNITSNVTDNVTASVAPIEILNAPEVISQNDSQNSVPNATRMGAQNAARHTTVLRAGFERTKPLNNLDVYGNKSTYNMSSGTSPNSAFNVSQRLGDISQITYNTDIYKPIYNANRYGRIKPFYELPDNLISKPVYSISGYPTIKAVNSIP